MALRITLASTQMQHDDSMEPTMLMPMDLMSA